MLNQKGETWILRTVCVRVHCGVKCMADMTNSSISSSIRLSARSVNLSIGAAPRTLRTRCTCCGRSDSQRTDITSWDARPPASMVISHSSCAGNLFPRSISGNALRGWRYVDIVSRFMMHAFNCSHLFAFGPMDLCIKNYIFQISCPDPAHLVVDNSAY